MEYLTLNNGVLMPLIGFGTFMLGGEACKNAVAAAIQSGYRMIDTAEAYGNEKAVGEGIKQSGMDRRALFLVTKVNFKSYENAEQTVMRSLQDLIAYNQTVPAVDQIETNLYCQRSAERSWMDKKQVAHMAYAPLGLDKRSEMFSEPAVLALGEKYRKTPAQILLRFLTQKGIAVIQRSARPEHIRENFALLDFALTEEELARLSALDREAPLIGRPETPELVERSLTW